MVDPLPSQMAPFCSSIARVNYCRTSCLEPICVFSPSVVALFVLWRTAKLIIIFRYRDFYLYIVAETSERLWPVEWNWYTLHDSNPCSVPLYFVLVFVVATDIVSDALHQRVHLIVSIHLGNRVTFHELSPQRRLNISTSPFPWKSCPEDTFF